MLDQGSVDEIRKIKVNQPSSGDVVKVEVKKKLKEKGNKKIVLIILFLTVIISLAFRFWEGLKNKKIVDPKKIEFVNPEKRGGVNWESF